MKKHLLTLVVLMLCSTFAFAQKASPVGIWTNSEGKARFEIYQCGNKLCGKIVSLKEPLRNGKPKLDDNNPDKSMRKRPLQGLQFLQGFEAKGGDRWEEGTIYDPESGKTYSSYMEMKDANSLEVKGYVLGMKWLGKSQNWTRVK